MKLDNETIGNLGKMFCGDTGVMPYLSGPQLIDFFSEFGFDDDYSDGFGTRWVYSVECFQQINKNGRIKGLIQKAFHPRRFVGTDCNFNDVFKDLKLLLEFDGYDINDLGKAFQVDKKTNVEKKQQTSTTIKKDSVFIVHGRDNEAKQEVARFIESIGLMSIILHEKPSGGRTIIEKIEHYSKISKYAIVLYTACDKGRGVHEGHLPPKMRARQNVVFEHGYLMAKLGRQNVSALVKGNIETPNDISGVVYITFDENSGWKRDLIRELNSSGYKVDENG